MKKVILMFNLFATFLFSFSMPMKTENEKMKISTNTLSDNTCLYNDSIVNITTASNLINVSGFAILQDENYVYFATSYTHYNKAYHYEVVLNDYTRVQAEVVGYAKEDEVLIFKAIKKQNNYCTVKFAKSEYMDVYEEIIIAGKSNYKDSIAKSVISAIGVCKNCTEETYKNYYYTLLMVDLPSYLIGAGVFDNQGALMGMILNYASEFKLGVKMLDVNKLYAITYNLINYGEYNKNYIKYNLLDVNSLTNHDKYLYSLDEEVTEGVLVSSVHYLNYIVGGLNQGMVILAVNNVKITDKYQLDNELAKYEDGNRVNLLVRTLFGSYKEYSVKL